MKANLVAILCLGLLLWTASATVFEAEASEDVDLFLSDYEDETVALFFYDSSTDNQDDEDWFARLSSKILGIFMSKDQFGRSTEDWVEMFDDKLHLMRIDVRNPANLRSREEFNIEDAPYIVLMDKRRTVLREKIDDETYEHVRMLLDRRPNMLHKTGGAALKSFSLEPDAGAVDTSPRVIQYFDLEEGAPVNVEEPIQNQYVNWAPVDVIGPDGAWEERGRDWVTSFEIPESGIKNQPAKQRVAVKDLITDDPRKTPAYAAQAPAYNRTQGPRTSSPLPAAPTTRRTGALAQFRQQNQPTVNARQASRPSGAAPTQTQAGARTGAQARAPAGTRAAASGGLKSSGRFGSNTPVAPPTTTNGARTSSTAGVSTASNGMPTRHPYHSGQYSGYGEYYNRV
jgi:hypothetical protein